MVKGAVILEEATITHDKKMQYKKFSSNHVVVMSMPSAKIKRFATNMPSQITRKMY